MLFPSQAVESIIKVANAVAAGDFEAKVVPMVRRLCAGQWFTAKCAACGLLPTVYAKSSAAAQTELLASFVALSKDSAPMVRRAATASLGPLAKVLKPPPALMRVPMLIVPSSGRRQGGHRGVAAARVQRPLPG